MAENDYLSVSQIRQPQFICYQTGRLAHRQIRFIVEDQELGIWKKVLKEGREILTSKLIFRKKSLQLFASFAKSFRITGVYHEDDGLERIGMV